MYPDAQAVLFFNKDGTVITSFFNAGKLVATHHMTLADKWHEAILEATGPTKH